MNFKNYIKEETQISPDQSRQILIKKLLQMDSAMRAVTMEWDNLMTIDGDSDEDIHSVLSEGYPLDKSFDEVSREMSQWIRDVTVKLANTGIKQ